MLRQHAPRSVHQVYVALLLPLFSIGHLCYANNIDNPWVAAPRIPVGDLLRFCECCSANEPSMFLNG